MSWCVDGLMHCGLVDDVAALGGEIETVVCVEIQILHRSNIGKNAGTTVTTQRVLSTKNSERIELAKRMKGRRFIER